MLWGVWQGTDLRAFDDWYYRESRGAQGHTSRAYAFDRVRLCLKFAQPERLSFAPDCGLSQTARWAARQKLNNMVAGVKKVREELQIN